MAKKYTIQIDADVSGQEQTDDLAKSLKAISSNADNSTKSIVQMNEAVDENSTALEENTKESEGLTESQKSLATTTGAVATRLAFGAAKAYAFRMAMARFGTMIPVIGTAVAVLTAAIIALNYAMKSTKAFIMSSTDIQKQMEFLKTSTNAWAAAWEDLSIKTGEFFFHFKRGWEYIKEVASGALLASLGLMDYYSEQTAVAAAQEYLTWELEKTNTAILKLKNSSEEYKKTIDDENLSQLERLKATSQWRKAQEEILILDQKRLEAEIIINKQISERSAETEAALEILNRQLDENKRQLAAIPGEAKKMADGVVESIRTINKAIQEERYQAYLEKTRKYIEDLELAELIRMRNEEGLQEMIAAIDERERLKAEAKKESEQRWNDAMTEEFTLEEEEIPEDPVIETYRLRKEAGDEYKEWLDGSLRGLGGMWGEYFGTLQDLYKDDVKWTELSSKQKVAIISMTAQATLGIANQLISSLAEGASQDFETQKKYKIAAATVSTLQGMVQAFTGAMQLGPIAGPIVGGILAAAVAAMGFANIAKIKKTQPESAVSSGDTGSGVGSAVSSTPSFSLINPMSAGESQLSQQIGETNSTPQKSYVVSSDMTTNQQMDRYIENQSRL